MQPFENTALQNENRGLRDRVAELEEELRQVRDSLRPTVNPPAAWRLTPSEWRVLWLLHKASGIIPFDRLGSLFYGPDSDRSHQTLLVFIMRLRRKLAAARTGIKVETRAGYGWVLEPESRNALHRALEAEPSRDQGRPRISAPHPVNTPTHMPRSGWPIEARQ